MIGNEYITRKDPRKKGLCLNQHGVKKFAVNFKAGIRELWKDNLFSIHNLQHSLNQEKFNFPLTTATEENKKNFYCNIVNNKFYDYF